MSNCCNVRSAIHCLIPPYIFERLLQSADATVREQAIRNMVAAASFRTSRKIYQGVPGLGISASPAAGKNRLVYTADGLSVLPGKLVRAEGEGKTPDKDVNAAYDNSGIVYDFFNTVMQRNSLDGNGMTLISTVHVGDDIGGPLNNAFWDGTQMAYGDGDGVIFKSFVRGLDVVGHELAHGVQSFSSNLAYRGQSGALNEHFADVFGAVIRHWGKKQPGDQASWLIGDEIIVKAPTRRALRDMENPGTAFTGDPYLGDDPQPAHMKNLYQGAGDFGGVHINSGIPNRAFVAAARAIGGNTWDSPARIWYETMKQLSSDSQFADCARICRQIAASSKAAHSAAVDAAWKQVGL